ncbi:unnamed protein product [Schistosoma margrebowiei]|uniref:Uncharacterized protein n=1 Tax=Schistosoma margrebowiei TaxID=48269 RepID=A0A183MMN5_9TREM|nr:unnamed protein product [Schistosoma margrebowiei]
MSRDISTLFTSLVSSIRPTIPELSPTFEEKKKKKTSPTGYEFSFQTRAESLHSSLKVLSNYLKRIHQLTAGTLGNSTKQRLHAELTENVTVLIEQCTLLLTQLKDLIHTTKDINQSKTSIHDNSNINNNNNNQLISHRLTIHKLLSEELDSLKKIRESEIRRQQRLIEFSGNLATGVRSVAASGANVTAYLKRSNKYDNSDTKLRRRGNNKDNNKTNDVLNYHESRQEENFTENELRTLEVENQILYQHFTQEKDELHQTTEKIADSSVTATEYIRQGNELLREAINSKATVQFWMLFILIILTFSLHFLDWFYP